MQIETILKQQIGASLALHQEILFAHLYGSFSNQVLPLNDVGVAVCLSPTWRAVNVSEYERALSVELTLKLQVPVDVRVLNQTSLSFQRNVLYRGELVFIQDQIGDEYLSALVERVGLEHNEYPQYIQAHLRDMTSQ